MAEMIRELVPCSEEIALPGLGVFVVEEVPAAFSDRGYTVNPPYLRLAFRQKSSEDNSLVNLYAKKKSISQKEAATILGGFFKRLAAVLKDKKSVAEMLHPLLCPERGHRHISPRFRPGKHIPQDPHIPGG